MVRPYQEKFVGFIRHWYEVKIVSSSLKLMVLTSPYHVPKMTKPAKMKARKACKAAGMRDR
jgi:hypothetical protein